MSQDGGGETMRESENKLAVKQKENLERVSYRASEKSFTRRKQSTALHAKDIK